mmetsp:Transcript_26968/g.39679  ORF Transcript_26968/g.39679 Transcript_26968/m.39679 type:complete len:84 (+) Transcript_26968:51-302(+)
MTCLPPPLPCCYLITDQLLAQPASSLATAQERSSVSQKKSATVKALATGVKHLYSGGNMDASDGLVTQNVTHDLNRAGRQPPR